MRRRHFALCIAAALVLPHEGAAQPPRLAEPAKEGEPFGTIKGSLYYADRPVTELTTAVPEFDVTSENGWTTYRFEPAIDGSHYEITHVPLGTYKIRVLLDANPENDGPPFPGDLDGGADRIEVRTAGDVSVQDIHLAKSIHLLRPVDNTIGDRGNVQLTSPVELAWEPLPEATHYECTVYRYGATQDLVFQPVEFKRTKKPALTFKLPASNEGQMYQVMLVAYRNARAVGSLGYTDLGGTGWFRFAVRRPDGRGPTVPPPGGQAAARTGRVLLHGSHAWDIDDVELAAQAPSGDAVDVRWFPYPGRESTLLLLNGARAVLVAGASYEDLDLAALQARQGTEDPVPASRLTSGSVLTVRTNQGNFAKLRIIGFRPYKLLTDSGPVTEIVDYDVEIEWTYYGRP